MLPARHRLRESADFAATVRGRGGSRSGSPLLVVHARRSGDSPQHIDDTDAAPVARVGFVVSKAVGNAVVRNRTKRRLRHLMSERLEGLPACDIVVRANPPAAAASSVELGAELDRLVARALSGGRR